MAVVLALYSLHVRLQNNSGTHLIKQFFALSVLLFHAAHYQCLHRHFGGETLIHPNYFLSRKLSAQTHHKFIYNFSQMRSFIVQLSGISHHKSFHIFFGAVLLQKIDQLCGMHCCQSRRNNLIGISHRYPHSFCAVINCQYSCHTTKIINYCSIELLLNHVCL